MLKSFNVHAILLYTSVYHIIYNVTWHFPPIKPNNFYLRVAIIILVCNINHYLNSVVLWFLDSRAKLPGSIQLFCLNFLTCKVRKIMDQTQSVHKD